MIHSIQQTHSCCPSELVMLFRWCRGRRPTKISQSTSEVSHSQVSIDAFHWQRWTKSRILHKIVFLQTTILVLRSHCHQARLVPLWSFCLSLWTASCCCAKVGSIIVVVGFIIATVIITIITIITISIVVVIMIVCVIMITIVVVQPCHHHHHHQNHNCFGSALLPVS